MKIIRDGFWVRVFDENRHDNLDVDKCGKWMYFFDSKELADRLCREALENEVVVSAKYTDDETGVICFYLNVDDIASHKKVIRFFIDNRLIRKTKTGRLYNISFKLDNQTRAGEYGADFTGEVKLADFVDLETGVFLK